MSGYNEIILKIKITISKDLLDSIMNVANSGTVGGLIEIDNVSLFGLLWQPLHNQLILNESADAELTLTNAEHSEFKLQVEQSVLVALTLY